MTTVWPLRFREIADGILFTTESAEAVASGVAHYVRSDETGIDTDLVPRATSSR